MQCQGKTRTGLRCRNRSLDSELFCDVHMRVNHAHNLTLMVPILLCILVGYFFFFGLLFETAIFGVFGINYLKYAGIEDLFLNMLRFGGMVMLFIGLIWTAYAILISIIFVIVLTIRMFVSTGKSKLGFVDRLKIIGLSLSVFCLNLLLMLVVLFPKHNRKRTDKMLLKRENSIRSLFEIKGKTNKPKEGKPFVTANSVFQNFLYFKNAGNHRFFISILLLLIVSLGMTYHAGSKAEYARACSLMQSGHGSTEHKSLMPFPVFILEQPCLLSPTNEKVSVVSLTDKFINSIAHFFDFSPVIVQAWDGQVTLLHLATTSRFDLFFNGRDGRAMALPKGALSLIAPEKVSANTRQTTTQLEKQFSLLEQQMSDSNKRLFGLGSDLKQANRKLTELSHSQQKTTRQTTKKEQPSRLPSKKTASQSCLRKSPIIFFEFALGSYVITDPEVLDQIVRLSAQFRRDDKNKLVISGYADPSGARDFNLSISLKRAMHVAQLLEKLGVNRHRLIPVGLGENESMRFPQRRVEIRTCPLD